MFGVGKKKMNNVMFVWKQCQYEGLIFVIFVEEMFFLSLDIIMDGSVNNLVGWGLLL